MNLFTVGPSLDWDDGAAGDIKWILTARAASGWSSPRPVSDERSGEAAEWPLGSFLRISAHGQSSSTRVTPLDSGRTRRPAELYRSMLSAACAAVYTPVSRPLVAFYAAAFVVLCSSSLRSNTFMLSSVRCDSLVTPNPCIGAEY
jgi:hypothetical protein